MEMLSYGSTFLVYTPQCGSANSHVSFPPFYPDFSLASELFLAKKPVANADGTAVLGQRIIY